jgi:Tfp pilus assembly protein PilF
VRNALLLVRRGKYEAAIRQAKSALRRDEKYVPAMVVMSRAYLHLNKLEFSESICDIALSINGNTGECYNIKGFIALKDKNDPLARAHFEKATQVQPSLGPPWLNLGAQYLKVKNYRAAIPALETAVSRMPSRPEAHLNLGSAYRGDGKLVKAQQSYKKALQLKGNNYPSAYFNLGILFLDAQKYPGMDTLQKLNTAVAYFNKYKQQMTYLKKDDPVDAYIKEAQKKYEREQKRREREAKRRARAKAKPAPKPKGK